jgi:hypothetical protein
MEDVIVDERDRFNEGDNTVLRDPDSSLRAPQFARCNDVKL